jgi:hypothetical protein
LKIYPVLFDGLFNVIVESFTVYVAGFPIHAVQSHTYVIGYATISHFAVNVSFHVSIIFVPASHVIVDPLHTGVVYPSFNVIAGRITPLHAGFVSLL